MTDPLAVLYEDAHVLAVDKPAGLLTQGTRSGEPTLEDAVRRHLGGPAYLGTVHRLDRPVSGVVVWAKTPKAARRLASEFAARRAVKEYWAVAEARDPAEAPAAGSEGVWDDWLTGSADASGVVRAAEPGATGARRAVTRFRVEPSSGWPAGAVRLTLRPETGRTHQLRAQAALRGLPVWGDAAYGAARRFPRGVALHARSLTFLHPVLRRDLSVVAPLPAAWKEQGFDPAGG